MKGKKGVREWLRRAFPRAGVRQVITVNMYRYLGSLGTVRGLPPLIRIPYKAYI